MKRNICRCVVKGDRCRRHKSLKKAFLHDIFPVQKIFEPRTVEKYNVVDLLCWVLPHRANKAGYDLIVRGT